MNLDSGYSISRIISTSFATNSTEGTLELDYLTESQLRWLNLTGMIEDKQFRYYNLLKQMSVRYELV